MQEVLSSNSDSPSDLNLFLWDTPIPVCDVFQHVAQ